MDRTQHLSPLGRKLIEIMSVVSDFDLDEPDDTVDMLMCPECNTYFNRWDYEHGTDLCYTCFQGLAE